MGATRLSLGLRVRPNGLPLSRAQVSAEDTPPRPDATAEMAVLSCHPPQALERLAGKPQGGVWCGMARPGWRTCPWDSWGLGSRLALVLPGGGPKPSHGPLCPPPPTPRITWGEDSQVEMGGLLWTCLGPSGLDPGASLSFPI